jgi:hypothetical protein
MCLSTARRNCCFLRVISGLTILYAIYWVFSAQADRTLTQTNHKNTEQSIIGSCTTLDGVTLTDPNQWLSVCREIPVCADKKFWMSNKPLQWTCYIIGTRVHHRRLVMSKLKSMALDTPSDRHLSAKLVPTFADRGCCVVSATDPHGC